MFQLSLSCLCFIELEFGIEKEKEEKKHLKNNIKEIGKL